MRGGRGGDTSRIEEETFSESAETTPGISKLHESGIFVSSSEYLRIRGEGLIVRRCTQRQISAVGYI